MFLSSLRRSLLVGAFGLSVLSSVVAAAPAQEPIAYPALRSVDITSFDGTKIRVNIMPAAGLAPGRRAPTLLHGPGYSHPGWTDPELKTDEVTGEPGVGDLRHAGYNVVTWDPRGFGASGGESQFEDPAFEGRDVLAIIDYLATQPEIQMDRPGDPRLGMVGGSYGGNIQLVAAALDSRIDAIAPSFTWHDFSNVMYEDQAFHQTTAAVICSFVLANGTTGSSPVTGEYRLPGSDPAGASVEMRRMCAEGLSTGTLSPDTVKWLATRGALPLLDRVKVPTLMLFGTTDALIPLQEGVRNYQAVKANGVPVKMVWFCGGHNACNVTPGPARVKASIQGWMDRYLKRSGGSTGSEFEWVDQNGVYRGAPAFPLKRVGTLTATGSGVLPVSPLDSAAAGTTEAAPSSAGGLRLPVPHATATITGAPVLTMTYTGSALTPTRTNVYAQVVDLDRGTVVGRLSTPIPVILDGRSRTVSRPLEYLGYTLGPDTHLEVQLVSGSGGYFPQTATGLLDVADVTVEFPLTGSGSLID